MQGLKQAADHISKAKNIAIACHINPDGDAIGSLLALAEGLKQLDKKVYLLSQDGVPNKYRHLPGANKIVKKLTKNVDLAITVDCSSSKMLGKVYSDIRRARTIIEIDHHQSREEFGDIRVVDPLAAAVGEQIYMLLNRMKVEITERIAQNILTSIIVETNAFRLPNVRPFTFKVCEKMVATGADFHKLVELVFWGRTQQVAILSGICLSRCKFLENRRIVWSIVKKRDFKKVNGKDGDVDAVADEMRAIKDVKIVVLFRERDEKRLRVSLRSKGDINIANLAASYGGGGHYEVAGCSIPNKIEAINELLGRAKMFLVKRKNGRTSA